MRGCMGRRCGGAACSCAAVKAGQQQGSAGCSPCRAHVLETLCIPTLRDGGTCGAVAQGVSVDESCKVPKTGHVVDDQEICYVLNRISLRRGEYREFSSEWRSVQRIAVLLSTKTQLM